jgi:chaperonin cofactor prefoldin
VSQEELVTLALNEMNRMRADHYMLPIVGPEITMLVRYMVRREMLLREKIESLEKRLETFRTFGVMTR